MSEMKAANVHHQWPTVQLSPVTFEANLCFKGMIQHTPGNTDTNIQNNVKRKEF